MVHSDRTNRSFLNPSVSAHAPQFSLPPSLSCSCRRQAEGCKMHRNWSKFWPRFLFQRFLILDDVHLCWLALDCFAAFGVPQAPLERRAGKEEGDMWDRGGKTESGQVHEPAAAKSRALWTSLRVLTLLALLVLPNSDAFGGCGAAGRRRGGGQGRCRRS